MAAPIRAILVLLLFIIGSFVLLPFRLLWRAAARIIELASGGRVRLASGRVDRAPMVLGSHLTDGRHWFTMVSRPPVQLLPVASNHAQVGHVLIQLVNDAIAAADEVPREVVLSRASFANVPGLATRYPEIDGTSESVHVRLELRPAPTETEDKDEANDGVEFLTPVPPTDWRGSYDEWVVTITRAIGIDAPPPRPREAYDEELAAATEKAQQRLPELRERYLAGLDGNTLGLKLGLATSAGGREFVWATVEDWSNTELVICALESEPLDVDGLESGARLEVRPSEVVDYAIGNPSTGVVDPGLTQRIAEDYGVTVN